MRVGPPEGARVVAGDPDRPPGGASISRTALSPPCLVAANTI